MARRRRHERSAGEARIAADRSGAEGTSPEVAAILHEELGRLPERYRAAGGALLPGGPDLRGRRAPARLAGRDGQEPAGPGPRTPARTPDPPRAGPGRGADSRPEPAAFVPAALMRTTIDAMLRFAAGTPTAGAVSATALSWTLRTLRTMQMTRLAFISALLIAGLAATGAAMWTTPEQQTAETRSVAPRKAAQKSEPAGPEKKVERLSVRVVDTKGRGVPDVEVKVIEYDAAPAGDGPGYRTASYRTGADGRVRITVDARYERLTFEARPDDRTLGWASLPIGRPRPKATDEDPITLTLLSRNHQVEGTIVDTRGKPIGGVQIRAVQFSHEENGSVIGLSAG